MSGIEVIIEGTPDLFCPSCKARNEQGAKVCKRCGELLSAKKKGKGKGGADEPEFDPTEGSFKPSCLIVPGIVLLVFVVILYISFRGPSPGTCEYNRQKVGLAISKYNRSHSGSKMSSLDWDALLKQDNKGKSFLKEKPLCPVDSSANYVLDGDTVHCSRCSKKR